MRTITLKLTADEADKILCAVKVAHNSQGATQWFKEMMKKLWVKASAQAGLDGSFQPGHWN